MFRSCWLCDTLMYLSIYLQVPSGSSLLSTACLAHWWLGIASKTEMLINKSSYIWNCWGAEPACPTRQLKEFGKRSVVLGRPSWQSQKQKTTVGFLKFCTPQTECQSFQSIWFTQLTVERCKDQTSFFPVLLPQQINDMTYNILIWYEDRDWSGN